ncbi:GxxExxY protein [Desulfovermiculus halophilus]|jgi:GxxExxY protein|uniref:GxxExxY protein n=1 Tax=Desulfovermiculus halophilus TaxID=339722 RepID=UPI0004824A4E|nr:GxxExxY protein [Desulfovermiculus halophilus]
MRCADEVYAILGACFEVYKRMGCGFLEAVYQECLEIEFEYKDIPFISQPELKLTYRDRELKKTYEPDFVCYDQVIVEIKAVREISDDHYAQLLNYLHGTDMDVGLLANFGHYPKLEYKRMVM